jgi:hypothetical protein
MLGMWHRNVWASRLMDLQNTRESSRKGLKIAKESAGEGAPRMQRLYMTYEMRNNRKRPRGLRFSRL